MKNERGFALVITLIITALLVALSAEFVDEVFVDTSSRANYVDGQQASLMASSGLTATIKALQFFQGQKQYTAQVDLDNLAKMLSIEDEKGNIQVTIIDESGKLNINALTNDIFRPIAERLFRKLGLDPDMVDAIADWIGTNEVPRPAGAKTPYYQTLKPPYAAKGGAMDTFEELRLVKGFDKKTVELLRPYLTVYPNVVGLATPMNVNTAPKELLASLDEQMTDGLAQEIVERRKTDPFQTANPDLANNIPGMRELAPNLASNKRIMQTEKGDTFRIIVQAQVGETIRNVEAVVNVAGNILYWREY